MIDQAEKRQRMRALSPGKRLKLNRSSYLLMLYIVKSTIASAVTYINVLSILTRGDDVLVFHKGISINLYVMSSVFK